MLLGDILYLIAIVLFVFLTFGIVKNYYKQKFNENDERIDMLEEEKKE